MTLTVVGNVQQLGSYHGLAANKVSKAAKAPTDEQNKDYNLTDLLATDH